MKNTIGLSIFKKTIVISTFVAIFLGVFICPGGNVNAQAQTAYQTTFTADNQLSDLLQDNGVPKKKFDTKDIPRAIQYMKTYEKRNLKPIQSQARPAITPTPTSPVNQTYIQPILFLAGDMTETPGNNSAITATFQLIKRWYSGAIEQNNSGYAFRVADTIIYRAPQPFSYYKCPNHEPSCDNYDGIWGNIQTELMNADYPLWSNGTSFIVFVKGAGGWAGANCVPNCGSNWPSPGPASQAGFGILGDWALDGITGLENNDCLSAMGTACYQDPQRGAVGHELGHTFGLAHAMDKTGSIMYSWWDFPYDSLFAESDNDEKSILRNNSSFFSPVSCSANVQVSKVIMPATVKSKTQFNASFNVTNYGFCHWSSSNTSLNLIRDNVWRVRQQSLAQDVYPAQPYNFSLELTAPSIKTLTATYLSNWQMMMARKFFGPEMGGSITVTR